MHRLPTTPLYYCCKWYLDTWCRVRTGFRYFASNCLHPIEILDSLALDFRDYKIDHQIAGAYGICTGVPTATAVRRFTPSAARWVADEQWHPAQDGQVLADGGYKLRERYSRSEELVLDILKYGVEIEVISPPAFREHIATALLAPINRNLSRAAIFWQSEGVCCEAHTMRSNNRYSYHSWATIYNTSPTIERSTRSLNGWKLICSVLERSLGLTRRK